MIVNDCREKRKKKSINWGNGGAQGVRGSALLPGSILQQKVGGIRQSK